jgi:predicted nucleotidyltransferase
MNLNIDDVKEKIKQIILRLGKREILAVGLFGSLARGDLDKRSDVDIFVITEKEPSLRDQDELYFTFSPLISQFGRDITVLIYDINSLKKIPSWQTLNLLKDAYFVDDQEGIEETFKKILYKAQKHGIIYDDREKVFKLKDPKRLVFSFHD